ncbi:hypothetical protein [Streptomyces griseus]|uniref:hypothetical protein n=1 Tax=Streptomyces griseus TaxID=1911 RepID=UPI0008407499
MNAARGTRARPGAGGCGPCRAVRESLEILGLRALLLAYWGTVHVLARRYRRPRTATGESVRPER